jgi:hypothetical protein
MNPAVGYARTQADGLDNIAPTSLQGQQAWQYAQSDNFLSAEEASAVMRKQLEPYRAQIEAKLSQIGFPPDHLANHPHLGEALFSGERTGLMKVRVTPDVKLEGRLRIVMTDEGPDIRITPVIPALTIPDQVAGIKLSNVEKQQLAQEGALPRPFLIADKGEYVPTYLRVDTQTNTVELWRVRAEQLPTKLMGVDLTKDQQLQLANGHAVRLSRLLDQQGEPFTATVSISPTQKEFRFTDVSGLAVGLKPDNEKQQQLALNNEGAKTDLTRSQELSTGQTTVSNNQRETMQQLLESKPAQKIGSPRQHLQ